MSISRIIDNAGLTFTPKTKMAYRVLTGIYAILILFSFNMAQIPWRHLLTFVGCIGWFCLSFRKRSLPFSMLIMLALISLSDIYIGMRSIIVLTMYGVSLSFANWLWLLYSIVPSVATLAFIVTLCFRNKKWCLVFAVVFAVYSLSFVVVDLVVYAKFWTFVRYCLFAVGNLLLPSAFIIAAISGMSPSTERENGVMPDGNWTGGFHTFFAWSIIVLGVIACIVCLYNCRTEITTYSSDDYYWSTRETKKVTNWAMVGYGIGSLISSFVWGFVLLDQLDARKAVGDIFVAKYYKMSGGWLALFLFSCISMVVSIITIIMGINAINESRLPLTIGLVCLYFSVGFACFCRVFSANTAAIRKFRHGDGLLSEEWLEQLGKEKLERLSEKCHIAQTKLAERDKIAKKVME